MKNIKVIVAVIWVVCLMMLLAGSNSFCMAQSGQRLTRQEAIAAARRNAKPESLFTVLREILADDNTRRIGNQALEQAQTQKIPLYKNGFFSDLLRSGGFLLAETEPQTNSVIAFYLIALSREGTPNIVQYECYGTVKLPDAEDLANKATELAAALYSIPLSEATSLESRFYGGSFPECAESGECTLFAIPRSLLKVKADQSGYREVAALHGSLELLGLRYAASMTSFSANPLLATQEAADKLETLKAEFFRTNHIDAGLDVQLKDIRNPKQLRERTDLLKRLDSFLETALNIDPDSAILKANISVATIPLQIGQDGPMGNGQPLYGSGTASLMVIHWQRLSAGGFAVKMISEAE